MIKSTILNRWYQIPKNILTKEKRDEISQDLIFKTGKNYVTGRDNPSIFAFKETSSHILVPKYYGLKKFGKPETNEQIQYLSFTSENCKKKMKNFAGDLRKELGQNDAFDICMKSLNDSGSAYLCLPPGEGKTTVALKILSEICVKTLVFVHKKPLMDQWMERIKKFLPDVNIGILHQNKIDVKDKQIVITTIQSTLSQKYECLNQFGMIIFDEAHHVSANYFSKILNSVCSFYMLALTGTPERKDNAHLLLEAWIGPISFQKTKVFPQKCYYHRIVTKYVGKIHFIGNNSKGKNIYNNEKMITELCSDTERNEFVLQELKSFLVKFPERRILFIVDRTEKGVLWFANKMSFSEDIEKTKELKKKFSAFYGETKAEERERILKESQVIFATSDIFSEGIDCDTLSVLFLVSPIANLSQLLFRVIRANSKENPIVIDFVDHMKPFLQWSYSRQKYLKKNNFQSLYNSNKEDDVDCENDSDELEYEEKKAKHEKNNPFKTQIAQFF
jgi:superfamily II DNA or RNA helicase